MNKKRIFQIGIFILSRRTTVLRLHKLEHQTWIYGQFSADHITKITNSHHLLFIAAVWSLSIHQQKKGMKNVCFFGLWTIVKILSNTNKKTRNAPLTCKINHHSNTHLKWACIISLTFNDIWYNLLLCRPNRRKSKSIGRNGHNLERFSLNDWLQTKNN